MASIGRNLAPASGETLAAYVQRGRMNLGLSQKELAEKAGIHPQSVGKIERGQTTRLKQKPKSGLAHALSIPVEYLDAVCQGRTLEAIADLKFCPQCWMPGTPPDPMWTALRSKYCFAWGSKLQDCCSGCHESIVSLRFRFCPYC
ncbi:MAG: helix-turn-helix domain-containing protein, partial [Cyanobacteria bacterium J06638_6]